MYLTGYKRTFANLDKALLSQWYGFRNKEHFTLRLYPLLKFTTCDIIPSQAYYTTVGSMYNACFYDLLETGKNYQTCMEQGDTAAICTHGLVSGGREAIRAQTLMCRLQTTHCAWWRICCSHLKSDSVNTRPWETSSGRERESLLMTTLRKRILSIIERLLAALAEHLMIDLFGTMDRLAGGNTDTEKMVAIVNLLTEESAKTD